MEDIKTPTSDNMKKFLGLSIHRADFLGIQILAGLFLSSAALLSLELLGYID